MSPRTEPDRPAGIAEREGVGRAMSAAASGRRKATIRLESVGRLIGDDSPAVRTAVRDELLSSGRAGHALARRAARSSDARVRSHARQLEAELDRHSVVRRLTRLASRSMIGLESALFLLGRLERPDLDARPYRRALDAMASQVELRARHRAPGIERARVLVEYLGEELGYTGEIDDYHHPDSAHLHRTIELKSGLPLTLSAIYAFVAARAGLRVGILPLPGHVMVRLYGGDRNLVIDPFHGGVIRTQSELMTYLAQHGFAFEPEWFRDASGAALFRRQVKNLLNALLRNGRMREAHALGPILAVLGRQDL